MCLRNAWTPLSPDFLWLGEDVRTDLTLSWGQGGSGLGCSGTWFWAHRGSILAVWLQVCQLTSLKLICCVCKTGSGNTSLPLLGQKCSEWAQDQAGGCPPVLFLSVGHARHGASAGMAPGLGPTLWADGNARLPSKLSVAATNTKHPAEPTGHLQHPLQKGPWWARYSQLEPAGSGGKSGHCVPPAPLSPLPLGCRHSALAPRICSH